MWFLCGRWAVVAQHDAEGSGVIVGQRAAAAFIKEGQQEGEKQQSEEEEPQKKSQPTHPLQQPGTLDRRSYTMLVGHWFPFFREGGHSTALLIRQTRNRASNKPSLCGKLSWIEKVLEL